VSDAPARLLALAERAETELTGPDQILWLDRLQAEHENLRAVLEACGSSGDDEASCTGLRLAATLWWYWHVRGWYTEGLNHLEALLVRTEEAATPSWVPVAGAG
jgi:non-specific serine/threonine protein kinase